MSALSIIKGLVFDIKHSRTTDGPGTRTTVYLKGCPLGCEWCLNSENDINESAEVRIAREIENLGSEGSKVPAKLLSVEDIWDEIQLYTRIFTETGGGVTFSGGEPLYQIDFLQALLMRCKANGVHTAVDTTGFTSRLDFDSIIPFTDLFLYDIKHLDDKLHKEYTGVSNRIILQNLESLINQKCNIIIRYNLVFNINDSAEYVNSLIEYLSGIKNNITEIHILPFQEWTTHKYHKIRDDLKKGSTYKLPKGRLKEIEKEFIQNGYMVKIRTGN